MKCPKCGYLGFETGDRCRNCGYNFSLIPQGDPQPVDLDLEMRSAYPEPTLPPARGPKQFQSESVESSNVPNARIVPNLPNGSNGSKGSNLSSGRTNPGEGSPKPRGSRSSKLPFSSSDKGDEPLIRLPVTPRPPLSVRRTPDSPRLQVVSRAVRAVEREPALEFETARAVPAGEEAAAITPQARPNVSTKKDPAAPVVLSGPLIRVIAAAIDHVLLGAIDAGVIYFTLRIAGLSMAEWAVLPVPPLLLFLLLLKLAYFCAFTAVGGQTIGKMALRIRVVSEDNRAVDATLAMRRTFAGALSTAFLGLGLLPAFFDPERRAFHDRVARTRVVGLRTA